MTKFKIILVFGSILIWACSEEPYTQGKQIYEAYCLNCHMEDGRGLGALYPNLENSAYLNGKQDHLACLIYNGVQSSKLATVAMPAHYDIKPAGMTNLINFISYRWGNKSVLTLQEINDQLDQCLRK